MTSLPLGPPKTSKRQRQTQSCDRCRIRKRKCDALPVCSNCVKAGAPCKRLSIQQKRGPKRFKSSVPISLTAQTSSSSTGTSSETETAPQGLSTLPPKTQGEIVSTRQSLRVLEKNKEPISYQEQEDSEDDPDWPSSSEAMEPLNEFVPPPLEEPDLKESPSLCIEEERPESLLISEFLASPFALPLGKEPSPLTLLEFEEGQKPHKITADPLLPLTVVDPASQTAQSLDSKKSVIFQGYDFHLLSPAVAQQLSPSPQFSNDEFLPFHDISLNRQSLSASSSHSSVLSTDPCLHALGTSLTALQGLPNKALDSMDPFDLFFEVPQSPSVSSLAEEPSPSLLPLPTYPLQKQQPRESPLKKSGPAPESYEDMDPTWNENLLLGNGQLADYFAQLENQYLL